ncbi:hypothetical protein J437_LFUL006402, partial [Ladona fulva]
MTLNIALISETHLTNKADFIIPGFDIFRNDSELKYRGTAVVAAKYLQAKAIKLPKFDSLNASGIVIKSLNEPMNFISVYYPHDNKFATADFNKIKKDFSNTFTIFGGDFNAKSPKWGSKKENFRGKKLANFLGVNKFTIHASEIPTHHVSGLPHWSDSIDFFFSTFLTSRLIVLTKNELASDHLPLLLYLPLDILNSQDKNPRIVNFSRFSAILSNLFSNFKFCDNIANAKQIDEAVEEFTRLVGLAFMRGSVAKKRAPPEHVRLPNEILHLINERNKARKICQKNRTDANYDRYKILRSLVQKETKKFKIKRINKVINANKCNQDPKEVWRTVAKISGKKNSDNNNNLIIDNMLINNDRGKSAISVWQSRNFGHCGGG